MNYLKHYNLLINRAKTRLLSPNEHPEIHHILPRCMGGTDDKNNLVTLTTEEHYLAHQLLIKIYPGNHKIIKACQMMTNNGKIVARNNKMYGWIRRKYYEAISKRVTVDEIIYASIKTTAIMFNVSGDVVRKRCKSHKFQNWNFTDYPVEKKVGIRCINKISCEGLLFPSCVQAAAHFGISKDVAKNRCNSTKYPAWFIMGKEHLKITKRSKRSREIDIICDGLEFKNLYDAAKYFNICTNSIMYRLKSSNHSKWYIK